MEVDSLHSAIERGKKMYLFMLDLDNVIAQKGLCILFEDDRKHRLGFLYMTRSHHTIN